MYSIESKKILITGSTDGLGLKLALELNHLRQLGNVFVHLTFKSIFWKFALIFVEGFYYLKF